MFMSCVCIDCLLLLIVVVLCILLFSSSFRKPAARGGARVPALVACRCGRASLAPAFSPGGRPRRPERRGAPVQIGYVSLVVLLNISCLSKFKRGADGLRARRRPGAAARGPPVTAWRAAARAAPHVFVSNISLYVLCDISLSFDNCVIFYCNN